MATTYFYPASEGGTYTVNGELVGEDGLELDQDSGDYEIVITPDSNYYFCGLLSITWLEYLDYDLEITLEPAYSDEEIIPRFGSEDNEKYRYFLIEKMRKHFSITGTDTTANNYRLFFYNFFGELFKDPVTVNYKDYVDFCDLMDQNLIICSENNLRTCQSVYNSSYFDTIWAQLVDRFSIVGIYLSISKTSDGYPTYVNFYRPDYESYSIHYDYFIPVVINAKTGCQYDYILKSSYYHDIERTLPDEFNYHKAGNGTYWDLEVETTTETEEKIGTLVITGSGSLGNPMGILLTDKQFGISDVEINTIIIGAEVSRLMSGSLWTDAMNPSQIIIMRGADDDLKLDDNFYCYGESYPESWEVYTNNKIFMAYEFPDSMTITWHSLDEWEG